MENARAQIDAIYCPGRILVSVGAHARARPPSAPFSRSAAAARHANPPSIHPSIPMPQRPTIIWSSGLEYSSSTQYRDFGTDNFIFKMRQGKFSILRASGRLGVEAIQKEHEPRTKRAKYARARVLEEIGEHIIVFLSPVCSLRPALFRRRASVHVPDSLTPRRAASVPVSRPLPRPRPVPCLPRLGVGGGCLSLSASFLFPSLFVFSLFHPWRLRSPLASAATSALIPNPMAVAAASEQLLCFASVLCAGWVAPLANAQLISMSSTRAMDPTLV